MYKNFLDIGDFIGIEGHVFTNKVGEKSINVEKITMLSKSLKPLPLPKIDADGRYMMLLLILKKDTDRGM